AAAVGRRVQRVRHRRPRRGGAMTTTGRPAPVLPPQERDVGLSVPRSLAISAALGWRMLVVVAALAVIGVVAVQLSRVVVPVAIALLLAALLVPAVGWLVRHRVPRALATALVMVGGVAGLGGVLTFVIVTFVRGIPQLGDQLSASVDAVVGWLSTGPLRL